MQSQIHPLWIILVSALIAGVAIGLLFYFDVQRYVIDWLDWLDGHGSVAGLVFTLILAVSVMLLVPGVFFTMGAGFIFGVVKGTLLVVLGTGLGASLAFLIARHLFGRRASAWVMGHIRPQNLGDIIEQEGWKLVMFTRLLPLFPFKLSNYFFGLTRLRFKEFVLGTFIGIIPISLNNVYLGSIASSIASIGIPRDQRTSIEWTLYLSGFVLAFIALIGIIRIARRAIGHKMHRGSN